MADWLKSTALNWLGTIPFYIWLIGGTVITLFFIFMLEMLTTGFFVLLFCGNWLVCWLCNVFLLTKRKDSAPYWADAWHLGSSPTALASVFLYFTPSWVLKWSLGVLSLSLATALFVFIRHKLKTKALESGE